MKLTIQQKEIRNNALLIAKFEGYPIESKSIYGSIYYAENNQRTAIDTAYHTSWDWIMPVITIIEGMVIPNLPKQGDEGISVDFIIDYNYVKIRDEDRLGILEIDTYGEDGNKFKAVYEAVVKFIEWYNQRMEDQESQYQFK